MSAPRVYPTTHRAAEAWLDRYKRQRASGQPSGPLSIEVLGGGWWYANRGAVGARKLQGFHALAAYLLTRGQLRRAEGGYQLAELAASAPAAPERSTGARLRELEQQASALLAALGQLAETVDSARTMSALGHVKYACDELKQARIVAEVRAKYEQDDEDAGGEQDASAYEYRAKFGLRR